MIGWPPQKMEMKLSTCFSVLLSSFTVILSVILSQFGGLGGAFIKRRKWLVVSTNDANEALRGQNKNTTIYGEKIR